MIAQPRRVAFVINSLTSGGAERVFVDLLSALRAKLGGYETHLILLDREEIRHEPPDWVSIYCCEARFSVLRSVGALVRRIHSLKPDVVVSFLTRANVAALIASRLAGIPCVISERVHTTAHLGQGLGAAAQRALIRATYPLASRVVAVSDAIRTDLSTRYGVSAERIAVIHNPTDLDRIRARAAEEPAFDMAPDDILAVGRLTENKNFASLIDAFARSGLPGRLVIIGEGPLRADLLACADRAGVAGRVVLPGYVANPFPLLRAARMFASSSLAEGFPNAIVEALAVGCPVVSTDCRSGPREILQAQGVDPVIVGGCGILVPVDDASAMSEGLRLAADPSLTEVLVARGRQRAAEFSVATSVERYWSVIAQAIGEGRGLGGTVAARPAG